MLRQGNQFVRRALWGSLLGLWMTGLVAGALALWNYASAPGTAGQSPERWPAQVPVPVQAGHPTLVMLAHPRCPCTRASLSELAKLVEQSRGETAIWVLFLRPPAAEEGWENSDLWQLAKSIPGVRVQVDRNGEAAKAFGGETSGHLLFYGANGALMYSGGITAARGQVGRSAGGDAVRVALQGGEPSQTQAPIFGCPLQTPFSTP
jgi:hypothetical protein